ncbi:MAG: alpha/beta fold hydrolase [Bacteroidetes bacterium]|nr:alpha/beta fold hydrolase [Bacteroidota bacterium]
MYRFYSRIAFAVLAFHLTMSAPILAQTVVDTTLVMSDGAKVDALYVLPVTPAPPGGYPAIVLVHGFAGSKNNNRSTAIGFAREGYAATAYSVRGQGNSEGLFEFFTAPRILDDLRENIAFAKQLRRVNAERVAVLGGSQGGLHAWNAAAYGMGARCVVSIIANGRAEENWLENDALNWTFAAATMTPDVRFEPGVAALLKQARESGNYSSIQPYLQDHSTNTLESSVTTPTAIFVSYHDGFFNQNAALRQFHTIPAAKRIVLYPAGHDMPADPSQNAYVLDVIDRWLAFWLKDDASLADVASPDSAVVFFDGGTKKPRIYAETETPQWLRPGDPLPQNMDRLDLYFDASGLAVTPPLDRSERLITYINVLGSTPISFRTPPLTKDITILPPPGSGHMRVRATGAHYQMNVLLYDVDPAAGKRTPLCRGHRQADDPNIERTMDFELTSLLHTVQAGHVIEVLVNGGTALIPDQANNFGNIVLGPIDPSFNTFVIGGDDPSHVSLYVEADATSTAQPLPVDMRMRLASAWPNPARENVWISFELDHSMPARLTVHDMMGREIAVIAEGYMEKGRHVATLNSRLPEGIYVYRLTTPRGVLHRKMVIIR